MTYRKKLIEVDLPLNDINRESAREKSITARSSVHFAHVVGTPPAWLPAAPSSLPAWWMTPLRLPRRVSY